MLDLAPTNAALRERGLRMLVEQRRQSLFIRGTFPDADGSRRRRYISLDLKAVPANLVTAELRCLQLHGAIEAGTFPAALPWATPAARPSSGDSPESDAPMSCGAAIHSFEVAYWQSRPRNSASERTWERIHLELRRLPPALPCTLETLLRTITSTEPGTRTRVECCKVLKRLARHLGLPGNLERISELQGSYAPAERTIPEDDTITALLDALRPTKWGWCYAALATFGCRPAEIPSLVIHDDGTAEVLTIKRRNRAPALRTCFALPRAWIDRYALGDISIPAETRWTHPEDYDSARAKRFVDAWRHSRRAKDIAPIFAELLPDFDLYDLRHRWAIRSIEACKPLTLCARALGHSAAVHEQTYHRHIQASDLRRAMATESV
ncbi:hypothetical protein [Synechococcus sp. CBW1004]|uniref:hypothetical protein n=1 Tax=Synechococcus sp. CBW1004 TaxID=1353136 RepID=UPI0018CF6A8A|nr:hypothetical protein [Synechococcus sp. CBW1004]QPN63692.1 hypothetical protein H8F25_02080 [Synechococcus sp. CBW1004]